MGYSQRLVLVVLASTLMFVAPIGATPLPREVESRTPSLKVAFSQIRCADGPVSGGLYGTPPVAGLDGWESSGLPNTFDGFFGGDSGSRGTRESLPEGWKGSATTGQ